jgi:protein-S-isoprenylcysteine O-methyltransferase Ste14
VTLAGAVAVMALVVIPREERYMARKFGDRYLDYKRRVRRWV